SARASLPPACAPFSTTTTSAWPSSSACCCSTCTPVEPAEESTALATDGLRTCRPRARPAHGEECALRGGRARAGPGGARDTSPRAYLVGGDGARERGCAGRGTAQHRDR